MAVGFKFLQSDGRVSDIDDLLVRRDLFSSGNLWNWGRNIDGELGDNTAVNKSSPVQTVSGGADWKQVSTGGQWHTAAIKTDGTLWIWGNNFYGQLGDNTNTHTLSPIQTIFGGTNWKQVSTAGYFTAAIKTDGTLWTWGHNASTQLGNASNFWSSSPVQTSAGGTNWKQVSNGSNFAGAIKTDGTLWTWGANGFGQLGDNTTDNKWSPVQTTAGGTNWKQVSAYGYNIAAIKTDGTLWSWGPNGYGMVGDNTTDQRLSPVQTISGGTNWKQVSMGEYHTSAIKTDGSLWMWGYNYYGGLGDNTNYTRLSPVQTEAAGTNWKQVANGAFHTAAIKTDGTLWTWGENIQGELGDNSWGNYNWKSSPVQTISGGTNWKQVSCGGSRTAAITDIF